MLLLQIDIAYKKNDIAKLILPYQIDTSTKMKMSLICNSARMGKPKQVRKKVLKKATSHAIQYWW